MEYLTPRELAARQRRAVQTLANERSRGQGPPYRKFGNRVLYPLAEVERWEADQVVTPLGKG